MTLIASYDIVSELKYLVRRESKETHQIGVGTKTPVANTNPMFFTQSSSDERMGNALDRKGSNWQGFFVQPWP
jgi:hypothetical protein